MDDVARLVDRHYQKDSIGAMVPSTTEKEIFVTCRSVSSAEFFRGGRAGLNPSVMLTTPSVNYNGEDEIIYRGRRYTIYRTYMPEDSDEIELYLQEITGVSYGHDAR